MSWPANDSMEPFSALRPVYRPVGRSVSLSGQEFAPSSLFASGRSSFYGSGTQALAAALVAARGLSSCATPEVIIPAYACPDLVSAAVYADVKPVLVDFLADSSQFCPASITASLSKNTVAIVGVNFLGIPQASDELRRIANDVGVVYIDDSAQYFPNEREWAAMPADISIFSFGRGKPLSVGGGGMAHCRNPFLQALLPRPDLVATTTLSRSAYWIKTLLYNQLIKPWGYSLVIRIPGLGLGQTVYHPLLDINGLDQQRASYLCANAMLYSARDLAACGGIGDIVERWSARELIKDLPVLAGVSSQVLLRYPLLFSSRLRRDEVYEKLDANGLGASKLYPVLLDQLEETKRQVLVRSSLDNARSFASRLLTLPVHEHIGRSYFSALSCAVDGLSHDKGS